MTPTSGNKALEKAIDHAISVLMWKEFFYVTNLLVSAR